ncbi:MAG: hypothetical protein AMS25_03105 [Gemmatimonas sp. SM23_52]|nr:MAG: hypothetical protein AMS25_03105 [Gemmatimonas sp. SM23_52]
MTNPKRPDVGAVLSGLKDFQRDTVEYAFQRMYRDVDYTRRFLVADEVGLGKTLVARGMIAKAVDELWDTVDRIDVVYICSNAQIARQNISRLVVATHHELALASRITLLPIQLSNLRSRKLNFVSFTPRTSFDLRSNMGRARERALLYCMLRDHWRLEGKAPLNVLQGYKSANRFRAMVDQIESQYEIDRGLQGVFLKAIDARGRTDRAEGRRDLRSRFKRLCKKFPRFDSRVSPEDSDERARIIGELRAILARACMEALEPDLVILDEFQRFKHLLEGQDEAGLLARGLFDWSDSQSGDEARVLLLSATPYKMYTAAEEEDDDHYEDFLRTLCFLEANEAAAEGYDELLRDYRSALYALGRDGGERLLAVKEQLETRLRRVMLRTERLAVSPDRSGMLAEVRSTPMRLEVQDLHGYRALQNLAATIDHGDTIEYWKSAPYLLNFMKNYQFKKGLERALGAPLRRAEIETVVNGSESLVLSWKQIEEYERLDPANARLRWLMEDTIGRGLWRLLWLPPSLPYYADSEPFKVHGTANFTKRLVFSAWRVVPEVVAAMLSYEAERLMISSFENEPKNTAEARDRRRPLLRFSVADGRPTGMPVLGLMYPSSALAQLYDPATEAGKPTIDPAVLVERVEALVHDRLSRFFVKAQSDRVDESWYWAAPILLDLQADPDNARAWWTDPELSSGWSLADGRDDEDGAGWASHVDAARSVLFAPVGLGRPPDDLDQVVAQMALAGPGVAALRALSRVTGPEALWNPCARRAAGQIAWGFRTLFNQPESMALVRGMNNEEPYWRRVLEYCVAGNLQAVLDEYVHILQDILGLRHRDCEIRVREISNNVGKALTMRAGTPTVDDWSCSGDGHLQIEQRRMRVRFATRFGDEKSDVDFDRTRAEQVRIAFNSPFWPFVLATTSVGQEGLDFHPYCHAVVHWNLPSNPVDLEQREGRVHRYKGHAVRKNVARQYCQLLTGQPQDPWDALFDLAVNDRPSDSSDLVPFWIHAVDDGARVERHVPALPLSREEQRLDALRRALVLYRMVFGQPRQDDLLKYLSETLRASELEHYVEMVRIDLTPPRSER